MSCSRAGGGVCVSRLDPATLAATLGQLLDEPTTRAVMSARASQVAATLRWPLVARAYQEVFARAHGAGARPPAGLAQVEP